MQVLLLKDTELLKEAFFIVIDVVLNCSSPFEIIVCFCHKENLQTHLHLCVF